MTNSGHEEKTKIPKNLDEAIQWLHDNISDKEKEDIKSGEIDPAQGHLTIGRWMRNNWGLWKGSDLKDFFVKKGIRHADDMSGIILKSFERDLKDKPRELDKQIKYYRDYWKSKGVNPDKIGEEE